jgi:formyltetrahydrofolate deformylase
LHSNIAKITVIGEDKKGIIARITNFLFENGANIEDIDQKIIRNLFQMIMKINIQDIKIPREELIKGLEALQNSLSMEIKVELYSQKSKPSVAILVTREAHCLETILKEHKEGKLNAEIALIIGSCDELRYLADSYKIPFYIFSNANRKKNEIAMLEFLKNFEVDLIVLARYMKILSPDFVWRYENQIINIHPSLLPSFPGAEAYRQAFEKGVKVAGVTAHFVTMDLDQGPIIAQEVFAVESQDNLETIRKKGQEAEIKALLKAIHLFLDDKIVVYWNKVHYKD